MTSGQSELIVDGGFWPAEGQTADGWEYETSPLRLRLDSAGGQIDVTIPDGDGDGDSYALCSIPVAGLAALLLQEFAP